MWVRENPFETHLERRVGWRMWEYKYTTCFCVLALEVGHY